MKTCNNCNLILEINNFAKNYNCADGRLTQCKLCTKIKRTQDAEKRRICAMLARRNAGVRPKVLLNAEERKESRKKAVKKWNSANPHMSSILRTRRRSKKVNVTPAWANLDEIKQIYALCKEISIQTGILHHVDHYYPINGKTVSGFHVRENLQIITNKENLSKGNKHPDEFYKGV
jgi:hypothetical protein